MFEEHRPRLTRLAYQMLGSVTEAEDVVQEAYLRWQGADHEEVRSAGAWLTTVVSRLSIDAQKSARAKREQYVGPWLPEPLLTDEATTPFDRTELADSVSMALMRLLEQLTPSERAAFVLHEAFDYAYHEIADIVGKSEAACRQLVRRAKQRLADDRPRFRPEPEEQRRLVMSFAAASQTGEMEGLVELLAEDVTLWSDGGGRVVAALNPIVGAVNVARFVLGISRKQPPDATFEMREINGEPGFVGYVDGRPNFTATFEIWGGMIHGIHIVVNPEKLVSIPPKC